MAHNFALWVHIPYGQNKKGPWPESASEHYRSSYRRLSAKLVSNFVDKGCHVVSVTNPYGHILGFLYRNSYFFSEYLLTCTHEAEWTSFQTHFLSENVIAPEIQPGPLDL
jgi:hypothetical protein